jgi:hypothetical protein
MARWARAGYIQPTGQTLLASNWSFMPGTYQGAEAGAKLDYDDRGALSFSYMWTNEYKAPWYNEMDNFYQNDGVTKVIISTLWAHRTTLKTIWSSKPHLVRHRAMSINILPKPAISLTSRVTRFPPAISSMARATRPITTPSMIFMTAPRGCRRSPLAIRSVRWIYAGRTWVKADGRRATSCTYDAAVCLFQRSSGYLVG